MIKHTQAHTYRPRYVAFVTGWAATYIVTLCVMMVIFSFLSGAQGALGLFSDMHSLIFVGILSTLQFLFVRWSWGITLHHWLPFALLGIIAGEIAFQIFDANVVYPFPPKLWSGSPSRMPEPEHVMQLKYTLYQITSNFLLISTPLIFQWLALRKHTRKHGLWLLAAVVSSALTFVIVESGGILTQVLKLFDKFTEISLIRDAQPLGSIVYLLDWATPTALMGLVLYALLAKSVNTGELRSPVKRKVVPSAIALR